jgi:hypothetical protein
MTTHIVKSWPQFFGPIIAGTRVHELRRNDRNYKASDHLKLREYDPDKGAYTGRVCEVEITSITSKTEPCAVSGEGLNSEFCILSIKLVRAPEVAAGTKNAKSDILPAKEYS